MSWKINDFIVFNDRLGGVLMGRVIATGPAHTMIEEMIDQELKSFRVKNEDVVRVASNEDRIVIWRRKQGNLRRIAASYVKAADDIDQEISKLQNGAAIGQ
jgi:hypothetical protein